MSEVAQAVGAEQGRLTQTNVTVKEVTAQLITVKYDLLPDTNPGENGNWIGLWQNKDQIQWNLDADPSQKVTGGSQSGTVRFIVDLAQNNYILGYAVGPVLATPSQKNGNVCATVFIPKIPTLKGLKDGHVLKAEAAGDFSTNLVVGDVSGDGAAVKYAVPANCQPKTNKAWIGVFRGSAGYNITPEKAVPINSNEDTAWLGINHKFVAGKKYTLAYFMSGYSETSPVQTRMAATIEVTAE